MDPPDEAYWIEVTEDIPSVQACYDFAASDPSCGGVASFVGITRDNFNGRQVQKLSYEGYVPMAVKELRKLCDKAKELFPSVQKMVAVHILGDCPVGKASVVLVAASPHRRDALGCVGFMIDELKATVPIWKLEVYEDDSQWKENVEWHDGEQRRVMVRVPDSSW